MVGTVVGSGIFFKQNVLAAQVGRLDWILALWLAGGLLAFMGGLIYAELGAMLPRSGGAYVYLREAYGEPVAFLMGWASFFFSRSAAVGALAVASAELLGLPSMVKAPGALLLIAALATWNVRGVKQAGQLQDLAFYLKVGGLLLVATLPFFFWSKADQLGASLPVAATSWAAAFGAVLWAFDGWYNVTTVAEEMADPQSQIPRSLLGGIALVTFLYLAINLAIHAVVPMEELAESGQPTALMVGKLLGPIGETLIRALILGSVLGTLNACILCGPRVFYSMASDGLAPAVMAEVHSHFATPSKSILLFSGWSGLLVIAAEFVRGEESLFDLMTNYVIFGVMVFSALAAAAVIVLRYRHPEWERPYRCWGYPLTPVLFLISLAWLLCLNFWERPGHSLAGLLLIGSGLPYYVTKKG